MDKIKSILLKILIIVIVIFLIPFLLAVGMVYFLTRGIKVIKLWKEHV